MSSGPENRFIAAVHRLLPKELHREKTHNQYRGGTFDVWYSGKADMWVEYKWLGVMPKKKEYVVPGLSELQLLWGCGRHAEGRRVAVVLGCPQGGAVYLAPETWKAGVRLEEFTEKLMSKRGVAAWIIHETSGGTVAEKDGWEAWRRGPGNGVCVQGLADGVPGVRADKVPVPKAPG